MRANRVITCGCIEPAQIERGDVHLIERIAAQWLQLCKEATNDEPFYRPEWVGAYLRAFEPRGGLLLVTAHMEERLMGVLPLIEENTLFCGFPVRMLRGAANVHSCRFDLVRASGPDGELAVKAIWETIKKDTTWDVIELPYVPSGGAAEQLLRLASGDGFLTGQTESDETPYIPNLQHSMLRSGHSHFQSNVRRRMRKAREQWPVRLNRVVTTDPAALERFYELESSGWKGKSKTAIACSPAIRRFYDAIAKAGAQAGYFSLYLLEFGDTVVAGHFGLAYNGHYYSPKVAYDERFAAYGPGHLIVDAILRDIADRGFQGYDFLGPRMEWKTEWTKDLRGHSFCYVFRPGLFGSILYSARLKVREKLAEFARRAAFARVQKWLESRVLG